MAVPTSSPWRPSPAQSRCSGLLLRSRPRVRTAGRWPPSQPGMWVSVTARRSRPPGALAIPPRWAPKSHTLPPPRLLASPPAAKWWPACVLSRSVPAQASGTQGSRLATIAELSCILETPGKLPQNNDGQTPLQRLI